MSEFQEPAEVVLIQFRCQVCKLGRMVFIRKTNIQPKPFLHRCGNCQDEVLLAKQYPNVQFKPRTTVEPADANPRAARKAGKPLPAPVPEPRGG